jgi:hypothetical protein
MYLFDLIESDYDFELIQEIYKEIEYSSWEPTPKNVIWCYRWVNTDCHLECKLRWTVLKYLIPNKEYPYLLSFPLTEVVNEIRNSGQTNKIFYILSSNKPGKFIRMRVHPNSIEADHINLLEFLDIIYSGAPAA